VRPISDAGRPTLAIVIAAWNGPAALRACLQSFSSQIEDDVEVIVAANFSAASLADEFPFARWLFVGDRATVPVLRAAGVRDASGEIVALVEDHVRFDSEWCREIRRAHELPYAAIGGSVDNSPDQGIVDWAMYFLDYAAFMPPNEQGPVARLSGANVSYKRAALERVGAHQGFFENIVNEDLKRSGHILHLAPAAVVYHDKHYRLSQALADCYHLARAYAAQRIAGASLSRRIIYGAGSLVLPVLLPARVVGGILAKRRRLRQLRLALPALLLLELAWSVGEFCGYLLGEGTSPARWR